MSNKPRKKKGTPYRRLNIDNSLVLVGYQPGGFAAKHWSLIPKWKFLYDINYIKGYRESHVGMFECKQTGELRELPYKNHVTQPPTYL